MYRPFEAFRPDGRLISVIGSGGKTTLLRHLANRLPGRVILTTSTHIYPFPGLSLVTDLTEAAVKAALSRSRVVCLGKLQPSGKLSDPSEALPFEALISLADHVLAEADGSAGLPLKAHRPREPVIPACSDMTILMVGASGLGKPAQAVCHCPELFCRLAGTSLDEPVQPEHVARVLNREALADWVLVNQTDALSDPSMARRLCDCVTVPASPCALAPR